MSWNQTLPRPPAKPQVSGSIVAVLGWPGEVACHQRVTGRLTEVADSLREVVSESLEEMPVAV
jgi:hypothetical protein